MKSDEATRNVSGRSSRAPVELHDRLLDDLLDVSRASHAGNFVPHEKACVKY
jgi:hypothetical protein